MRTGSVRKRSADDQLIRAFGDGDEGALQELFIRFGPMSTGSGCIASAVPTWWMRSSSAPSSQYASSSVPLETGVVGQALGVAL
jgi:hypothetical protein